MKLWLCFVESAAVDSLLYHIWCTVCTYLLHTCTPNQPLGHGLFRKYVPHSKIFNSLSLSCSALKGCRVDQSLGAGAMKWFGMPTSDDSLTHMVLCGKSLNTNWCQNPFLWTMKSFLCVLTPNVSAGHIPGSYTKMTTFELTTAKHTVTSHLVCIYLDWQIKRTSLWLVVIRVPEMILSEEDL